MAFDLDALSEIRTLNFGRRYHAYDTTDDLSTVLTAGYFDAGWYRLAARDRLDIEASDGRIMAVVSAASAAGVTITASTDVIPAGRLGTGSVARSVEDELRRIAVPVTRFGAIGDGVTDDTAAINAAISTLAGTGMCLLFPATGAYYKVTGNITLASDMAYRGEGWGSRIVRTNDRVVFFASGNISNTTLSQISIESSYSSATIDYYGLVATGNVNVTNLRILDCRLSGPNCYTNAVKIILGSSNSLNGFWFQRCLVDGIGRMGVEIQDNNGDATKRIFDVWVGQSKFKDLGQVTPSTGNPYGTAISYSGNGVNIYTSQIIIDNPYIGGVEHAGGFDNCHTHDIAFINTTRKTDVISITGTPVNNSSWRRIHFGVTTDARVFASRCNNCIFEQLTGTLGFVTAGYGYVLFQGHKQSQYHGWNVKGQGNYVVFVTYNSSVFQAATDNLFRDCVLDGSTASSGTFFSTLRYDAGGTAANCTRNGIKGGALLRPGAGTRFSEVNSAIGNWVKECGNDVAYFDDYRRDTTTTASQSSSTIGEDIAQHTNHRILAGTGVADGHIVYFPAVNRSISIYNNTGKTIDVRAAGGSSGVVLAPTEVAQVVIAAAALTATRVTPPAPVFYGTVAWSGGGATLAATVTGVRSTYRVQASIKTKPTQSAYLVRAYCSATDTITFELSAANTSNDAVIEYAVTPA